MKSNLFYIVGVVVFAAWLGSTSGYVLLSEYGAIPSNESAAAVTLNAAAMSKALEAANGTGLWIPAGMTYYILNVEASNLVNTELRIDGKLFAAKEIKLWPVTATAVVYISDCINFTLSGSGLFDGQGFGWWVNTLVTAVDHRPHLFSCDRVSGLTIEGGLTAMNSPQYHFRLYDVVNVLVRNITVWVDVERQKRLLTEAKRWVGFEEVPSIPQVWALNTDGVDIWGSDGLVENITVLNYDDVVAIKPSNLGMKYSQCSRNIHVRDVISYYGVGQTIGSVPPDVNVNCVQDILFENVVQYEPLKGIYIKTNPGDQGSGIIHNITYRNITMHSPLWYPIWIGPQQECQPPFKDFSCNGCSFVFPISTSCPTQPRITVSDIFLQDINVIDSWDLPGVMLCNATNPCTNFNFNNLRAIGDFRVDPSWYCEYVDDSTFEGVDPLPNCTSP